MKIIKAKDWWINDRNLFLIDNNNCLMEYTNIKIIKTKFSSLENDITEYSNDGGISVTIKFIKLKNNKNDN